jgi:hypothetical protein
VGANTDVADVTQVRCHSFVSRSMSPDTIGGHSGRLAPAGA